MTALDLHYYFPDLLKYFISKLEAPFQVSAA